jgi:dihydroorotate dehydrogenase/NAD-dependent dihydropyrimidine dehydrogenase PreA subunit
MADLTTNIGKLKLKNPLLLGRGPLSGTATHIKKCADAGFGGIVTKTTTYSYYLQRYPKPLYRVKDFAKKVDDPFFVPQGYMWLHREHNSIYPPEVFAKIIKQVAGYVHDRGAILIGSFAGRGIDEWRKVVTLFSEAGVDAMELNFCCPFVPKGLEEDERNEYLGIYFSEHPEKGAEVIRKLKETIDIPLFPKLGPDSTHFVEMVKMFKEAGADGVSLFANDRVLRIDIETGTPVNYGPCGGTSNHFKAHTMKWVSEITQALDFPVLGGRGVNGYEDAVEYLMAGASGVEVCAAAIIHGLKHIKVILNGIENFMERKGYRSIDEVRGRAVKHIYSHRQMIEDVQPLFAEVDLKKCFGCGRCPEVCVYDAIDMLPKKVRMIKEKCAGCSLCSQVCPVSAISMRERDNDLDHFRALAWEHKELMADLFNEISQEKR